MERVLVFAVHPDDETLGCGGTLLKHKAKRDQIYWLIATAIKEDYGFKKETVLKRDKEIKRVASLYGFKRVYQLGFPTTKLDRYPMSELIEKISKVFIEIKPNIIYIPFKNDIHSDHRIIFEAAYSCTKIFRYSFIKKILMMETLSETELALNLPNLVFVPNYFVDISDFFDYKLRIIKVYKNEIGTHPFPRSLENIKALATFRGAIAGCKYAESFMILKEIC